MKVVELLISPDEVVKMGENRPYTDAFVADAIVKSYLLHKPPAPGANQEERIVYSAFLRAALYNAGRVCGIREERARRKGKAAKTYMVGIN